MRWGSPPTTGQPTSTTLLPYTPTIRSCNGNPRLSHRRSPGAKPPNRMVHGGDSASRRCAASGAGSNGAGARSRPISVACTWAGSRGVNVSPSSRPAPTWTRSTSSARLVGQRLVPGDDRAAGRVVDHGRTPTTAVPSSSSDRSTRAYQPGRGDRSGGQRGLPLAGLDQQAAARGEPAGRRGGHAPLDVEPVRAAVERHPRFVVTGLGRHQRDRVGRHVGRVGDHDGDPSPQRHAGSGCVEVALVHPPGAEVAAGARHRGGFDVDGVQLESRAPPRPGRWPPRRRRSTARRRRRPAAGAVSASRTSSSVRRRGTKTPGPTAIRRPQNSAQPSRCSSGSPATRRCDQDGQLGGGAGGVDEQARLVLGEDAAGRAQGGDDVGEREVRQGADGTRCRR